MGGPSGPPKRDSQAIAEVQASLSIMGGLANIQGVQSCVINLVADESNIGHTVGPLTLVVSGTDFRSDFTGPNGVVTLSTGNGSPYRTVAGTPRKVATHVTRAWFWPALVASELAAEYRNPDYSFLYKGVSTLNGVPVVVVATVSQATRIESLVTPQTWYFDSTNSLPIRVEYRLPDRKRPDLSQVGAVDLSKYQAVESVLYPFYAVLWINGKSDGVRTVGSVLPNAVISPAEFAAPGGIQ
jgi:hypothetical protein